MKRVLKVIGWVLGSYVALSCFGSFFMAMWLGEVPILLATGWAFFIVRVVPKVSVQPLAVLEAVVVLAALSVGLHHFMRWLWARMHAQEQGARVWPVRWSVSIVSLLVLLFLATMATVGVGHQVGWLASGRGPLLESSWGSRLHPMTVGEDLCRKALELSKGGVADENIVSALLANEYTQALVDRATVLPMRKPEGKVVFLVMPRDPDALEAYGATRCGGEMKDYEQEWLLPRMVPQVLAGEEMAGLKSN
jgi:hypothetical protein